MCVCQVSEQHQIWLTAGEERALTLLAEIREIPESDRVYPDCLHEIAAVILLLYVDNTGVRWNC